MPNAIAISPAPTLRVIRPRKLGEIERLLQSGSPVLARPSQDEMLSFPNTRWGGMTFTSWQFGVFAATVFTAYYLPALRSFQVQLLVSASLF